jgi:bifunctional DNA-binding transcriptional regulator/antitoxin component of YhaV-PrlF toxin-antitoxin module
MATNLTVKGQVTLPNVVSEATKIRPGDRVDVRAPTEGEAIIETKAVVKTAEAYINGLEDMSRRQSIRGFSTEKIMRTSRGED